MAALILKSVCHLSQVFIQKETLKLHFIPSFILVTKKKRIEFIYFIGES